MSRGPPKKRTRILLEDSDSESSCSYKDNSMSDDESFHAADDDNSAASYDTSEDPLICTQPARHSTLEKTPDKSKQTESSRRSRDISASVDSLAMVPDDTTHATRTTPKAPTNPLAATANIVSNQKSSKFVDAEEVEVVNPAQVSKKPSKLRLKLRMKDRSSDPSSKQIEERIDKEPDKVDEKTATLSKDASSNQKSTKKNEATKKNDKRGSRVHELGDLCADDDKAIIKKVDVKKASPTKSAAPKSNAEDKAKSEVGTDKSSPAKSAASPSTGVKRKRKVGKQHKVVVGETSISSDKSLQKTTPVQSKIQHSSVTSTAILSIPKPKPKKKKKTFQDQVLLHMMTTIKPFNLKGLASDLRTTDVALQNLMLSLLDKGVVRRKEFGKNKKEMYWVDLEKATKEIYKECIPSGEDMQKAKSELNTALEEENMHIEVLKGMESELTNEELAKQLEEEEKNVLELRTRMQEAKDRIAGKDNAPQGGNPGTGGKNQSRFAKFRGPPKKPKTRKQLNKAFNEMRGEWKSRKEKCMDFIDNLSDAMEKRPKEVMKMLEFETDEMLGVNLPPKRNLDD